VTRLRRRGTAAKTDLDQPMTRESAGRVVEPWPVGRERTPAAGGRAAAKASCPLEPQNPRKTQQDYRLTTVGQHNFIATAEGIFRSRDLLQVMSRADGLPHGADHGFLRRTNGARTACMPRSKCSLSTASYGGV